MSITIDLELSAEEFSVLKRRAQERGCLVVDDYVRQIVNREIRAAQTFDEILAPIRAGFAGMAEDETEEFFNYYR